MHHLTVCGPEAKVEGHPGLWHSHHPQQVTDKGLQADWFTARLRHPFNVDRVDEAEAVTKYVRHVVFGDQSQALGREHDAVVDGEGNAGNGVSGQGGSTHCDQGEAGLVVHHVLRLLVHRQNFCK